MGKKINTRQAVRIQNDVAESSQNLEKIKKAREKAGLPSLEFGREPKSIVAPGKHNHEGK